MRPAFWRRLERLAVHRSKLCVGLDPSAQMLAAWGFKDDATGLRRFSEVVMEAAGDRIAVFKPQSAFYERHGPAGVGALKDAVDLIAACGALSIVDAKRGDYAPTMAGYAAAVFSQSGLGADAMTANAYLGFAALNPALEMAHAVGGAVFVVTRSSNPEGAALQNARLEDGRSVAESLADDIHAFNIACSTGECECEGEGAGAGPAAAVVGSTMIPVSEALLERMPHALILAPGVGVQGGRINDLKLARAHRVLPSVSRSLLHHGPNVTSLREEILRLRENAFGLDGGLERG